MSFCPNWPFFLCHSIFFLFHRSFSTQLKATLLCFPLGEIRNLLFLFLYNVSKNSDSSGSSTSASAAKLHFPLVTLFGEMKNITSPNSSFTLFAMTVKVQVWHAVAVRQVPGIDIFQTDKCAKFSQVATFFVAGLIGKNTSVRTLEVCFSTSVTDLLIYAWQRGLPTRGGTKVPVSVFCFSKFVEQFLRPLLFSIFLYFWLFLLLFAFLDVWSRRQRLGFAYPLSSDSVQTALTACSAIWVWLNR